MKSGAFSQRLRRRIKRARRADDRNAKPPPAPVSGDRGQTGTASDFRLKRRRSRRRPIQNRARMVARVSRVRTRPTLFSSGVRKAMEIS
jgi:hypothetical protein